MTALLPVAVEDEAAILTLNNAHAVELSLVHRVSRFGTRGHIGDLSLGTDIADRDRVVAIAHRVRTKRNAVHTIGGGEIADGDTAGTRGPAVDTQRRGIGAWRVGEITQGRAADTFGRGEPTDRGGEIGGSLGTGTEGRSALAGGTGWYIQTETGNQIGQTADRHRTVARSQRLGTHRGRVIAYRIGHRTEGQRLLTGGKGTDAER